MIIDAHQHFWNYDPVRDAWITDAMSVLKRDFSPSNLVPELDGCGIDATIAVQADQSGTETQFLLDVAEKTDRVAGVVGWLDLRSPALEERLRHFSRFKKLRGLRHIAQAEPDDGFLARPEFVRGVSQLKDFGLTYDILIYPKQLPAAIELVSKLPEQKFVVDHLGKPEIKTGNIAGWAANIREIAASRNVYCKLSGMVTEARWREWRPADFEPYLDVVFECFGSHRLIFGSDWPVCLTVATYTQVKDIVESYVHRHARDHRHAIFGDNATAFYDLKL
ncbi:MAG: amidohydrolase family protein [Candidatus Acidiferrum sp.]